MHIAKERQTKLGIHFATISIFRGKVDTDVLVQSKSLTSGRISIAPPSSFETTPVFTCPPVTTSTIQGSNAESHSSSSPKEANDMTETVVTFTKVLPIETSSTLTPSLTALTPTCTESNISTAELAHILTTPKRKIKKLNLLCQLLSIFFHERAETTQAPNPGDSCSTTKSLTSTIPFQPNCIPLLPQTTPKSQFTEIEELKDESESPNMSVYKSIATVPNIQSSMPLPTTFVHLSGTVENSATFHANEPDNAAESKEFTDTSDLSINLVKLTDTPDSNAITPGMIFSVLSSSCHDQKRKHQVQSKKLTDFVNTTPSSHNISQ